jgi:hypothetical protein
MPELQHAAKMPALAGTPPESSRRRREFPSTVCKSAGEKKAGSAAAGRRPSFARWPPPAATKESLEGREWTGAADLGHPRCPGEATRGSGGKHERKVQLSLIAACTDNMDNFVLLQVKDSQIDKALIKRAM